MLPILKRAKINSTLQKTLPAPLPPIPLPAFIKAKTLAKLLKVRFNDVVRQLCVRDRKDWYLQTDTHRFYYGEAHDVFFPYEIAADLVTALNRVPEFEDLEPVPTDLSEIRPDDPLSRKKVPVVAVMGHVDHGKTTLLDAIRNTQVAAGEVGKITQRVSAFDHTFPSIGHPVTFLDTPGHEAFFKMRNSSAIVADAVILVVAADEGIRKQTKEVVQTCRKLDLPVLVALNKIDAEDACPGMVRRQLRREGLKPEAIVEVSALRGTNVRDQLLGEALPRLLKRTDVKSYHEGRVEATVLEARFRIGMGTEMLLIVHRGIVKKKTNLFGGMIAGRVKHLRTPDDVSLDSCGPGLPVAVLMGKLSGLGAYRLKENAPVGEVLFELPVETAERVIELRELQDRWETMLEHAEPISSSGQRQEGGPDLATLEARAAAGEDLGEGEGDDESFVHDDDDGRGVVIRADTEGAYSMFLDAIKDIPNVQLVGGGIGEVTQGDVELAATGDSGSCRVFAFNVTISEAAKETQRERQVDVISWHNIFYELLNDMRQWSSPNTSEETDL